MAISTNISLASKYAMNIANDGPVAIYDILPIPDAMESVVVGGGGFYDNQEWPDPPHPTVLDDSDRWSYFRIPSNHTLANSNAYYLHSRSGGESEWPVVSGLPILYGGEHRVRYSLLNRDVNPSEPSLPFLQTPSFGIGQKYLDRCRSIEWWMETDPYSHPVNMNMFDDQTSVYSPAMALGTHYTLAGSGFVKNPAGVALYNPDCHVISLNATTITFVKDQPVIPAKRVYTFAITVKNAGVNERSDFVVTLKLTQDRIDGPPLTKEYSKTFQAYKADGWTTYIMEFVANEAMTWPTLETKLYADQLCYFTEMGLWAGQGGRWAKPSFDSNSDVEFISTSRPSQIMTVGGVSGSAVTLSADANYLYLRSVDQFDSYYVGEWGRQMHMTLIDEGEKYSLYLNAERIMSVLKNDSATTGVAGEFVLFYISPLFKYIDISTIAIYPQELSVDAMRLHYVLGCGPKYNDILSKMPYENVYVADGSAIDFSGHCLFPQSHSFQRGTSYGVNSAGNSLTLSEYHLPTIYNATHDDIVFELGSANEYSLLYFKVPDGAYMSWSPRKDVDDTINYVFIDVASLLSNNVPGEEVTKICRVESKITASVLDFFIEIDLTSTGDFSEADFNRDFSTSEKRGSVYAKVFSDQSDTVGTEVFRQEVIQSDFSLVFNIEKLIDHYNRQVAIIFADPEFNIVFDSGVELKSLSCATKAIMSANDIWLPEETEISAIQIDSHYDDFGTDQRNLLGNATYSVYPNVSVIDGKDFIFLDIAAAGYWKVNIPLVNLAAQINGVPDLDFIMYSDSERLPQVLSGLNTNRLTYSEISTYIMQRTQAAIDAGKYSAAQTLFAEKVYSEIGLEVTNGVPTLGRFANPPIQTFVTLDSQSRFPFKEYSDLKTVKATTSMFVDFENSGASVVDNKWEILNNFAIRVPKDVRLQRYELSYAVHLRTPSMTLQRPVLRHADFFGLASGVDVANSVSTGTGKNIYVGNKDSYNLGTAYSVHAPTETFASLSLPKLFGFFPHSQISIENEGSIVYSLTEDEPIKTLSFYMLWRGETFPNDPSVYPGFVDKIGSINYISTSDESVSNTLMVTSGGGAIKIKASLSFSSTGPDIYVDGIQNGLLGVNKWHLIQVDVPNISRSARFIQYNDKAVMNFVTSSVQKLDPAKLYASRTGAAAYTIKTSETPTLENAVGYVINRNFNTNVSQYVFDL
jgi:hypothetical protein